LLPAALLLARALVRVSVFFAVVFVAEIFVTSCGLLGLFVAVTLFGGRPGLRCCVAIAAGVGFVEVIGALASLRGRPGLRLSVSELFVAVDAVFDAGALVGCDDDSFLGRPGLRVGAGVSGTELRELVRGIYLR
jgi:hypothetical protein